MDPKKQDLNPELKQIYERVMNTQVTKPETPATSTPSPAVANSTPVAPPTATPITPAPSSTQPTQNAPFLSTAAPKPITENKTFVFTGNKIVTPQAQSHSPTSMPTVTKKGITGPVIGVLVVVLIAVWGIFWAKLFGLF